VLSLSSASPVSSCHKVTGILQSVGYILQNDKIFNPACRPVTVQEFLGGLQMENHIFNFLNSGFDNVLFLVG
jgi:hypothetical protein